MSKRAIVQRPPSSSGLRHSGAVVAISIATLVTTMWFGCSTEPESSSIILNNKVAGASEPEYRNLDPSVSYVGIEACVECHPAQASTFVESQMGRSFKPATRTHSVADWDNARPTYDPFKDFYYLPYSIEDSLFLMEFRLVDGDTVYKRIEKIDYIVGSGQHTNSHMMEVNGYIYQMPITWYAQEKRWDLPPGFDGGHNWRFDRAIEVECMTCHNAMPDYLKGSDNRFEELPHGINCERCHGPGELHVAEKKAGKLVDTSKEIDRTIVNPGKLPRDLQFDVCRRCHLQGVAVPREGFSFTDFRPGMRLGDVIDVYFPRYTDSLSHFIMASHPDRLRMAECGIPSQAQPGRMDPLPCTTCHDPHIPIEARGRSAYNAACIDCHSGAAKAVQTADAVQTSEALLPDCSEDPTVRAERNDDCSSCHMPLVESIDIPHVRITDHNIRIPDEEAGAEDRNDGQKRFVRLASLTSTQPSHKMLGEGYLTYYEQFNNVPQFLDSASVNLDRARSELSEDRMSKALIRLWYLEERYDEIAALVDRQDLSGSADAWTFYRIGEAYSNLGRHRDATVYYQHAVDRGPDHLWFRTKLASAFVSLRDVPRAIAILDAVLRDNPKFHHAYNNRGFAHLLAGDFSEAQSDFRMTLSLDPDAEQALANLASLYLNTDEPAEAKLFIDRLVKLKPDNAEYKAFQKAVLEAL